MIGMDGFTKLILADEFPGLENMQIGVGFMNEEQYILQILFRHCRVNTAAFVERFNKFEKTLQ